MYITVIDRISMISKKTDFLPFTEDTVMNPKITEISRKLLILSSGRGKAVTLKGEH